MSKKDTKREMSSSFWNIITKPNKVTVQDILNNKKKGGEQNGQEQ